MREDDDDLGHYVPLLRRIIILVAVITAVPVVLWTITAFVRAYVGPARIPTFHQLASTASINSLPSAENIKAPGDRPPPPVEQDKLPNSARPSASTQATVETKAMPPDDSPAAPKSDRTAESDTATAAMPSAVRMASTPPLMSINPKGTSVFPPPPPMPAAVSDGTPTNTAAATLQQQPAVAPEPQADAQPAATPLPGPIPLPRRRPRDLGMVHIADMAPSSVPVPRPRPDSAGLGAPAEDTGGGALGFIQNIFGGK